MGGLAVHIGARVAACASAGKVLVSITVKDLRWDDSGLRQGTTGPFQYPDDGGYLWKTYSEQ